MARFVRLLRRTLYFFAGLALLGILALGVLYWLIAPRLPDVQELRNVQLSRVVGSNWVVESGLTSGERVIVAGLQKVRPGAVVNPAEQGADASSAQAASNPPANK